MYMYVFYYNCHITRTLYANTSPIIVYAFLSSYVDYFLLRKNERCSVVIFQYYFIKSKLSGLVLDVESSNTKPGAWVSTWGENGTDAQKWYDEPSTRTIRSKLNDFCMDIEGKMT